MELLKEYQTLYKEFDAKRQELTNAEKLFDLPITAYPHLVEVEKELKGLTLVYDLYEAQRVSESRVGESKHGGKYTCCSSYVHVRTCMGLH